MGNEELNRYIKGEKKTNIFTLPKVRKMVEDFVKNEIMKLGFSDPKYKVHCVARDNRGYDIDNLGQRIFENNNIVVKINNLLVDAIGDVATEKNINSISGIYTRIDLFQIIFHELEHVRQAKMYETNTVDNMDLYKDKVINLYFNSLKPDDKYYEDNYKVITEEVLANIKGVERTIEYFNENNIELSKAELEILKSRLEENKQLLENKKRKNPITLEECDLDDLYNMVLEDQTYQIGQLLEDNKKR